MSTLSDPWHDPAGKRSQWILAILLVFVSLAAFAAPAPQPTTAPPASAEERGDLRRKIEGRYEVLPVSGGIALTPRRPRAGIRTIEVTGGLVAVNGETVRPRTLRDWLGEDADLILRLQGLAPEEQRRMFGMDEAAAEGAPDDETPAESDVTELPAEPAEPGEPAEPAEPAPPVRRGQRHSGEQVNVGGGVLVGRHEIAREAVAIGGSVQVDGEVENEVVAVGGSARINGRVGGDVTAVGAGVKLGPNAVVEGGVTSVGGRIQRAPGAVINGPVSEVSILPFAGIDHDWGWGDWGWHEWGPWSFWGGVSDVMSSLMWLILMGLLSCLVLLIARQPLERADRQLANRPWPAAAAGLAGMLLFWPLLLVVTILLAITLIGCVLFALYPFLFLYAALLLILGYAAAAYRLGRWLEIRFNRRFGSPYAVALMGVLLIQVWSVIGELLDMLPGPFNFFSWMVQLFAFLVQAAAWIVGFGAVILARFGLQPGYWPARGAPSYGPPPDDQLPLTDPLTAPGASPRWEEPGLYPPDETEPTR